MFIFSVLLYLSNLCPSPLPLCCAASCPCSLGWTDVLFMAGGKQPPSMGGAQTAQPQHPRTAREEQTQAMLNRSLCLALQNKQLPSRAASLARAQCLSTARIKQQPLTQNTNAVLPNEFCIPKSIHFSMSGSWFFQSTSTFTEIWGGKSHLKLSVLKESFQTQATEFWVRCQQEVVLVELPKEPTHLQKTIANVTSCHLWC